MADPTSTDSGSDSLSISEAVARMGSLEGEDTTADTENAHLGEKDDVVDPPGETGETEGEEVAAAEGEAEATEQQEQTDGADEPPEFWSAEDKAVWATVPLQLRPMIRAQAQKSTEYANAKAEEAAQTRREAAEQVKAATSHVEQAAKWWQENGPTFFKAFGDKWAQVDWNTLARENPAEWAAKTQERANEEALLRQAAEQGKKDIEAAQERGKAELAELKVKAHETIAKVMPDYFGTVEKAKKTYSEVGAYLQSKGFSPERINIVHEAPLFEIFTKAYLYDKAKTQTSTVTGKPGAANKAASTTPTRVQPGPAARTGNQGGERARQARERIQSGKSLTIAEAAALANSIGA